MTSLNTTGTYEMINSDRSPSLAGNMTTGAEAVAKVLWLWHYTLRTQDKYIGIKTLMSFDLPLLNAMPLSL